MRIVLAIICALFLAACGQTDKPAAGNQLSCYALVTLAYWSFMLTDGALRMMILLQFHRWGFSAVQLAFLFILYEVCGIFANLGAGKVEQCAVA